MVNASGEEYYRYCSSQVARLNLILPAFHTIFYQGPVETKVKLRYGVVPSTIEDLYVNESIDIKHTEGTLQRTIVVDARKERLSVSFDVRKFVGPTDYCGYGGIRMFNQDRLSYFYDKHYGTLQAHIPHRNKYPSQYLIFERRFYLDFGKTYFVFYDFNSVWSIDVTLSVNPSIYNAIYNFEESYCNDKIVTFIFKDLSINCALRLIRLKRQVPIILQWSRDSLKIKLKKLNFKSDDIKSIWPGIMVLTVTENFGNVQIFNPKNEICKSATLLLVTGLDNVTSVLLGRHTQKQSIPNAESLTIQHRLGNCPILEQGSHAITLTPSFSKKHSRCISMRQDFQSQYLTDQKYQTLTKGCVSLNTVMSVGMYKFYVMEPLYAVLPQNKWIYYYLSISEHCYRRTGMKIYFQNIISKKAHGFYFKFPEDKNHYIFFVYGVTSLLYFHLERYIVECTAYIEFTSTPYKRKFPYGKRTNFKVSRSAILMVINFKPVYWYIL